MPRGRKPSGRTVATIEAEIKRLEEEKKNLIAKEREERLAELDEIVSNSPLSLAQIKKAIKDAEKSASQKPKRKRRTKAEMAAAREAEEKAGASEPIEEQSEEQLEEQEEQVNESDEQSDDTSVTDDIMNDTPKYNDDDPDRIDWGDR